MRKAIGWIAIFLAFIIFAIFIHAVSVALAEEQSLAEFHREFKADLEDRRRTRRERRALELQAEGLREMRRQTRALEQFNREMEQRNRERRRSW